MVHFQNTLVSFKLVLYFQYIKPINKSKSGTIRLPHIPHTTNDTTLKDKRKSNYAQYLVTGVQMRHVFKLMLNSVYIFSLFIF